MSVRKLLRAAPAVSALVLALAAPGSAWALAYDHTDPVSTGCATGAYTVTSSSIRRLDTNAVVGTVELRWSPSCRTNWARLTPAAGVQPVFAQVDAVRPSDGAVTSWVVRYGTTWPLYGDQLNGATNCVYARAYFTIERPSGNEGAYGQTACY